MLINYNSLGSSDLKLFAGGENERMRILSNNGNVGIDETASTEKLVINGNCVLDSLCITANKGAAETLAQNSAHGNYTLAFGMGNSSTIDNDVYMYSRNRIGQAVYGAFALSNFGSDDRRKHNEIPITNALDAIMKLHCETYDKTFVLKDANYNGRLKDEAMWKESGLIAQDVYKLDEFKDYVRVGNETTSWDINYNSIFTYNIRATQELKLQNDELKKKVNDLEHRMDELGMKLHTILQKFETR